MPPFFVEQEKEGISGFRLGGLMRYLTVDGMLSGTGVRDSAAGGYVDPREIGLSASLVERIEKWVLEYEAAHYERFIDKAVNERLDQDGVAITRQIRASVARMSEATSGSSHFRWSPHIAALMRATWTTLQPGSRPCAWRDYGGSGCGPAMAMDEKLRRSFLSDRLELRLLLVAQRRIEVPERGAHQADRLQHGFEPPIQCVQASGWCGRVFRLASSVQDFGSPGIGVLQRFESGALSVVRVQPGLDLVRRPLQRGWLRGVAS
jgi:hypothetical protein